MLSHFEERSMHESASERLQTIVKEQVRRLEDEEEARGAVDGADVQYRALILMTALMLNSTTRYARDPQILNVNGQTREDEEFLDMFSKKTWRWVLAFICDARFLKNSTLAHSIQDRIVRDVELYSKNPEYGIEGREHARGLDIEALVGCYNNNLPEEHKKRDRVMTGKMASGFDSRGNNVQRTLENLGVQNA